MRRNVPFKVMQPFNLVTAFIALFFQAILMEIQRLCPVVPLGVPHGALKDIKVCEKWAIPKGAMIMISHWSLNFDPDVFEHPQTFKPFRFYDEASGKLRKSANLMPFQV